MATTLRRGLVVAALLVLGYAVPVHADAQDFTITDFEADYFVTREADNVSALRVTEKITAQFPNTDQNHGILRAIPKSYQGHGLELKVHRVSDGRSNWQYETYTENNNLVLKIGDPDRYVHGAQTYVVEYTMRGVISNTYGAQQFYWNVNGLQWQQVFNHVVARVHVPATLAGNLHADQALCYTGPDGSTASDCQVKQAEQNGHTVLTFETIRALQPGETLSVVAPFRLETFAPYSPSLRQWLAWAGWVAAITLPPLAATAFIWQQWRRRGRDPKGKGVIVPQYLPPKEVSVLGASVLLKEGFEGKAVAATIIDLAVRRYLKVYEVKKDQLLGHKTSYELELTKDPAGLRPEELRIVAMLFSPQTVGTRVSLDAKQATFYKTVQKVGSDVEQQLAAAGYFAGVPSRAKLPYLVAGIVIFFAGFFFIPLSLGVLLAGVVLMVGSQAMPARTPKGVVLRDYLYGLRDYMKLAEAERLKVLQSPHGELTEKIDTGNNTQLVKLYEKLLPYALLFNIEESWAAQFAHLYQQPPEWYSGPSGFNAVYFAGALHSFNSAAATSFSPPSSSGSGAGGGGSGGGGGGW